jgi:hypothetical protein
LNVGLQGRFFEIGVPPDDAGVRSSKKSYKGGLDGVRAKLEEVGLDCCSVLKTLRG